jgi:outer membrane protein TolC
MLLRVQEDALEQAKKSLERTEALLEVGSATRADVLKARVLHSNTRLNLIRARNAVELAREDLVSLLSFRETRSFGVDTTMTITYIDPDIDEEIRYALEHRPDLRSLDYSIKSAGAGVAAAKSGWLPTIGASFSYGWNDREMADNLNFFKDEYAWAVIGYVSVNIFDRFATSANVRSAKASHRIAEYNLKNAKLQAVREIKSLVFMLREARERISVATETVEQAMEDVRLADERYRVGAGTMLETIDAQVALTQAKADVIDAKCDYLIAGADLARATGRRAPK